MPTNSSRLAHSTFETQPQAVPPAQALAAVGQMTCGITYELNNLLTGLMVDIENAFAGASASSLRHLIGALDAAE